MLYFFFKFVLETPVRCAAWSPSCPNICNAGALNCSKILVAICIAVAWKEQGLTYFQRGTQRKGADSHWHLVKAIGLIQHFFYWTHVCIYIYLTTDVRTTQFFSFNPQNPAFSGLCGPPILVPLFCSATLPRKNQDRPIRVVHKLH